MDLLIVGLGNPGRQYDETRHNVGFDFIERLAELCQIRMKRGLLIQAETGKGLVSGSRVVLVRPQTYMNRSGDIFPKILKQHNMDLSNLVVVCDNLDIPPGAARLKLSGSSAGQKGLGSIIKKSGSQEFKRLYLGVGRPVEHQTVVNHVLSKPRGEDARKITEAIDDSARSLLKLIDSEAERVVHEINSRKPV